MHLAIAACGLLLHRVAWSVGVCVCLSVGNVHKSCKNGWIDRDAVWSGDSGGLKKPGIRWDPIPQGEGTFWGESGSPLYSVGKLYGELCKNGWTDRDANWDKDSGGPKEPCIRLGLEPPQEGALLRGVGPTGKHGSVSCLRMAERLRSWNKSTESSWPKQHCGVVL